MVSLLSFIPHFGSNTQILCFSWKMATVCYACAKQNLAVSQQVRDISRPVEMALACQKNSYLNKV